MEALSLVIKPAFALLLAILGIGGIAGLLLWLAMRGKPSDRSWFP